MFVGNGGDRYVIFVFLRSDTGTFTTVDAIGEAEDVADIIYDISPTETPFLTGAKKGTASNVLHQWQTDALASANKDNASAEGMDATTSTASPTVMYSNYCQILQKTPRVSGTLRKVKTYGRADDMSREIVRRGKELKRDLESALLSGNGATAGSATNARKMAGVGAWLWVQNLGWPWLVCHDHGCLALRMPVGTSLCRGPARSAGKA